VPIAALWRQIIRLVEDSDREALTLWRAGEPPVAIAKALGLSHLPALEQRRAVKRFNQRIVKRLRTHLARLTNLPSSPEGAWSPLPKEKI
jgi:hypothetical protein